MCFELICLGVELHCIVIYACSLAQFFILRPTYKVASSYFRPKQTSSEDNGFWCWSIQILSHLGSCWGIAIRVYWGIEVQMSTDCMRFQIFNWISSQTLNLKKKSHCQFVLFVRLECCLHNLLHCLFGIAHGTACCLQYLPCSSWYCCHRSTCTFFLASCWFIFLCIQFDAIP